MNNYQHIKVHDRVFVMGLDNSAGSVNITPKMTASINDGKLYEVTEELGNLALLTNGDVYHKSDLHLKSNKCPYISKFIKTEPQFFNVANLEV